MKKLTKDAKSFVDGIVGHLKKDNKNDRPFPQMKSLLKRVSDDAWMENTAKITTAVPLTPHEKEQLTKILSHKLQKPIILECRVVPALLGGIKIEIADLVIDLSYEEKLRSVKTLLLKGSLI